jgi:hypothetical protein
MNEIWVCGSREAILRIENRRPARKHITVLEFNPFKDEAQTALFKYPVRTAQ